MNKEFVTYEQAKALENLEMHFTIDSPCYMFYSNDTKKLDKLGALPAPLYQQAFRWFREKHDLEGLVYKMNNNPNFFWFLIQQYTPNGPRPKKYIADCVEAIHKTYEEAESACLDKLIQIVTGTTESRHTK